MITDPQNVFEELQNDVATKLMETSPFSTFSMPDGSPFNVLTEDEGDIQFTFDAYIAQLGLAIVVHSPTGEVQLTDLPGPLIDKLGFDVWVSEAPTFNREYGTRMRLSKATALVLLTLHGFQPQSVGSPVYAQGFKTDRERTYMNDEDKVGTFVISRICHFVAPIVGVAITNN